MSPNLPVPSWLDAAVRQGSLEEENHGIQRALHETARADDAFFACPHGRTEGGMMRSEVLTDELLARAERVYTIIRMAEQTKLSDYDGVGGASARFERGWSAEDEKKWLT